MFVAQGLEVFPVMPTGSRMSEPVKVVYVSSWLDASVPALADREGAEECRPSPTPLRVVVPLSAMPALVLGSALRLAVLFASGAIGELGAALFYADT